MLHFENLQSDAMCVCVEGGGEHFKEPSVEGDIWNSFRILHVVQSVENPMIKESSIREVLTR
jgi:hypothetical protein